MPDNETRIREGLNNLIKEYEEELTFLHNRNMEQFDPEPFMEKLMIHGLPWVEKPIF